MNILSTLLIAIIAYCFIIFIEFNFASKANFDCSKCKNFMCNARSCEQKRREK